MSATKIFAINSSPSEEKGTTARLLQAFLKGASEAGAETRVENIFEQDINPCVGCIFCWIKTPGECAQKDDMKKMLEKSKDSDIIVYSTARGVEVEWGRVMKLDRDFKKLRFLRNDLNCRLTPTETVKVLMEHLDEQIGKLQAWA